MRFQVQALPGGALPVEQAASLLAMHCLVCGRSPCDYMVLVAPHDDMLDPVGQRAQELLDVGRTAARSNVRLSPRELEVLDGVLQDRSNKEIGVQLHLSERTVKYHVSSLLAKFNVCGRVELRRDAAIGLLPASAAPGHALFGFPPPEQAAEAPESEPVSRRGHLLRMPQAARSH
jgi:DNA-binding CsgD family transcriptional regulator